MDEHAVGSSRVWQDLCVRRKLETGLETLSVRSGIVTRLACHAGVRCVGVRVIITHQSWLAVVCCSMHPAP